MVSRNALSIILLVVAFGLVLGPISYFFQQMIKSEAPTNTTTAQNMTTTEPEPIQPVYEYQAVTQGVVKSKEGLIAINARSDFGNEEKINETLQTIPGVINVALLNKTENPGETGLYLYKIHLIVDPNDTEKVGYYLMTRLTREPFNFVLDSVGVPAKVSLPSQLNMSRVPSGGWEMVKVPNEVDGYVYSYTNVNQTTTFLVRALFVGPKLDTIMAFEKSRIYMPPVKATTVEGNVTIVNITGYGAKFSTDYDVEVNTTHLEELLAQHGVNTSISFIPPKDSFQVRVNNSMMFVEKLNESGIKAQAFPGGATIWIKDTLNKTMEVVRSIDPTVEYPQLTGLVTAVSKQPLDAVLDLIPGNLTERFLTGFVFVPAYNDTVETRLPVNVTENEIIPANITVRTIFGDIQHPVSVDVLPK